jgi:hypothetical protein
LGKLQKPSLTVNVGIVEMEDTGFEPVTSRFAASGNQTAPDCNFNKPLVMGIIQNKTILEDFFVLSITERQVSE